MDIDCLREVENVKELYDNIVVDSHNLIKPQKMLKIMKHKFIINIQRRYYY